MEIRILRAEIGTTNALVDGTATYQTSEVVPLLDWTGYSTRVRAEE
jgi:hypothetical protein